MPPIESDKTMATAMEPNSAFACLITRERLPRLRDKRNKPVFSREEKRKKVKASFFR